MYRKDFTLKSDSRKSFAEEKELVRLIEINETKLKERLCEEDKNILDKIIDCKSDYLYHCCSKEFISGFRLGSRLIIEIFLGEDNSHF